MCSIIRYIDIGIYILMDEDVISFSYSSTRSSN